MKIKAVKGDPFDLSNYDKTGLYNTAEGLVFVDKEMQETRFICNPATVRYMQTQSEAEITGTEKCVVLFAAAVVLTCIIMSWL
tara:strand:+ start:239 stop:487 length:249 start_codon:yes stop_codon:yes gene_type:complete